MKYTFKIIIFISLLFSLNIYANFEYSLKAGTTYSKLEIKDNDDTSIKINIDYKLGLALFLSMKNNIKNNFYFSFNLGLNQKGNVAKISEVESKKKYSVNRSYYTLETPFVVGYNFFENISLYFGAYFSFVLATSNSDTITYGLFDNEGNMRNDIGFLLGLEYIYDRFSFNFMFERGYGNLYPPVPENPVHETNSRQFIFMFGYTFF